MDIFAMLSEERIFPCVEVESKRQLFEEASKIIAAFDNLDENKVFEALWERENLGTTGYGEGIAVPHARISDLKDVTAIFMRLNKGIDFDAFDNKNVDIVAVIISPEQSGEDHLQALSSFSAILRDESICKKIRQAKTAHEIYSVLNR